MVRFVLLVVVGSMLWLLGRLSCKDTQPASNESLSPPMKQGGSMVRCAYCDLHIPEQESVHMGEKRYCCKQHQLLHQRQ